MLLPRLLLLALLFAGVVFLPYLLYLLVVSVAAAFAPRRRLERSSSRQRFLIVIPAHNEEAGIAGTVRSCRAQDYPAELFEVMVIADNCDDQTAVLARQEGANVLERFHPTDRSKGHALKYMFDGLSESGRMEQLDAVVIIDADSIASPSLLQGFAEHLERGEDWVQAFDTVANQADSWRTQLMSYSFALINGVFLMGQNALGLSASFRGNGMCMSTRGLRRCPWRTFGLVEDLEYSWTLRAAGEWIAFAPETSVHATMLSSGGTAAANQRRRWEWGRSQLKRNMIGPLIRSRSLRPLTKLAAILELTMPTLVVLASYLCLATSCLLGLSAADLSGVAGPFFRLLFFLNLLAVAGLLLYGLLPFLRFSLPWNVLLSMGYFPIYAAWKLVTRFQGRPTRWIRTAREQHKLV